MIKEAIEKILSLATPTLIEMDGRSYCNANLALMKSLEERHPATLEFPELKGFCEYINNTSEPEDTNFVMVPGPHEAIYLTHLNYINERHIYARAKAKNTSYAFGQWTPVEEFIVALDTMFVPCEAVDSVKSLLGHIANENIKTHTDNGFAQSIQVRTGITTKAEVRVENPIKLKPFRTFLEIDQPEIPCLLRLKTIPVKGGEEKEVSIMCNLWSADGGLWELSAIRRIGAFIRDSIPSNIKVLT